MRRGDPRRLYIGSAPFGLLALLAACESRPKPPPEVRVVRPAHAAGKFYTADAAQLRTAVRGHLDSGRPIPSAEVRMVLVPHAGYFYSGKVAAAAFRQLWPDFERVVILAANHRGDARYAGVSVCTATHYAIPGAEVKVAPVAKGLLKKPLFVDVPAAHTMHMIEIELPFLEAIAKKPYTIVPLVTGRLGAAEIRSLVDELARLADDRTVFVISVDLSHFFPYDQAVALDRSCLGALEDVDLDGIARCTTDGTPLLVVMAELALQEGWIPRLVTYANSAEASGDKTRVVGYGAMIYEVPFDLNAGERRALLQLARTTVEEQVLRGQRAAVPPELVKRLPRLAVPRAAFVTLRNAGRLRGCMGSFQPSQALAEEVRDRAIMAATGDRRFRPIQGYELGSLEISISVLDKPLPVRKPMGEGLLAEFREERPGLILDFERRRSTFLPKVWDQIPEPTEFLRRLCQKQGSPQACFRDARARLKAYRTQDFSH